MKNIAIILTLLVLMGMSLFGGMRLQHKRDVTDNERIVREIDSIHLMNIARRERMIDSLERIIETSEKRVTELEKNIDKLEQQKRKTDEKYAEIMRQINAASSYDDWAWFQVRFADR